MNNMSKYEKVVNNFGESNIDNILFEGESVIWSGKPKKSAFVINKVFTMMPIAILWLAFDSIFIVGAIGSGQWFILLFLAFHLFPVWLWLSNVLTASKRWKNTQYIVTDKRIIISSGFVGVNYQTIYYKDIRNVSLRVGLIDKMLGVGDIYFDTNFNNGNNNAASIIAFLDVSGVYEIYPKLQKVILDIQTDIEYPNNFRPNKNDGYNTKYNSKF